MSRLQTLDLWDAEASPRRVHALQPNMLTACRLCPIPEHHLERAWCDASIGRHDTCDMFTDDPIDCPDCLSVDIAADRRRMMNNQAKVEG